MSLMTAQEYIESLRKLKTVVYLFGERVDNFVDHPIIRPSVNSVAMTYALAQNPQYKEIMTTVSHLTGERINRFCHIHQSREDLVNKVKMQRILGQKTGACFQRCVEWMLLMQFILQPMKQTRNMELFITGVSAII